jgi:hypothetical protein
MTLLKCRRLWTTRELLALSLRSTLVWIWSQRDEEDTDAARYELDDAKCG